jgi:hypothetical protein
MLTLALDLLSFIDELLDLTAAVHVSVYRESSMCRCMYSKSSICRSAACARAARATAC